jgi:hypothetical protein
MGEREILLPEDARETLTRTDEMLVSLCLYVSRLNESIYMRVTKGAVLPRGPFALMIGAD